MFHDRVITMLHGHCHHNAPEFFSSQCSMALSSQCSMALGQKHRPQSKAQATVKSTGHSQKHRPKLHGEQRQKKRANRNRKRLQQKRQMQKTRSQLTLLSSQIHQALPSVGQSLPKIPGSTRRRSPPRKSLVKGERLVRAEGEPEGRFEDTQTACPEPLRWPRLARPRRSGKRRGNAAGRKGARLARLS